MELSSELFEEITGVTAIPPSDAPQDERRQHTRVTFGGRARVLPLMEGAGGYGMPAMVRDISRGGVGFLFNESLEVGDEFIIHLPKMNGQVAQIQCMVARCEPGGCGGVSFVVGAQFELVLEPNATPLVQPISAPTPLPTGEQGWRGERPSRSALGSILSWFAARDHEALRIRSRLKTSDDVSETLADQTATKPELTEPAAEPVVGKDDNASRSSLFIVAATKPSVMPEADAIDPTDAEPTPAIELSPPPIPAPVIEIEAVELPKATTPKPSVLPEPEPAVAMTPPIEPSIPQGLVPAIVPAVVKPQGANEPVHTAPPRESVAANQPLPPVSPAARAVSKPISFPAFSTSPPVDAAPADSVEPLSARQGKAEFYVEIVYRNGQPVSASIRTDAVTPHSSPPELPPPRLPKSKSTSAPLRGRMRR